MLPKFSVKKPFTVIVTIIIVAILGVVSYLNMTVDLMPSMNMPYAIVSTQYIGASPEEVEQIVSKSVEESMSSINNIKTINSISSENISLVVLEFNDKVNMDTAVIEMREKLDMLSSYFPSEVGTSTILKINPSMMPIMAAAVSVGGMQEDQTTSFLSQKIIPEIESIEGVASVSSTGLLTNIVDVKINQEKVSKLNQDIKQAVLAQMMQSQQYNSNANQTQQQSIPGMQEIVITDEMVEGILKGQNFSMPTGNLTQDNITYLVKTGDKIKSIDELKGLTLISLPIEGFEKVKLSDVADIQMLTDAQNVYSKINGQAGVVLTLSKQADFSTAEVSKNIIQRIKDVEKNNSNVKFTTLMDQGDYVNIMIDSIFKNIIIGAILAAFILLMFLKSMRSTIVVSLSIVLSLVTAYVLMYFSGLSLNIISMGGLALGIGMLVDNSIVVIENIYRMRLEGMSAREASIKGAKQVSGAISASTLTTIIVFVPILFTHGFTKKIFLDMGLTIAFSLIASLVVALTFVPMMSATVLSKKPIKENKSFEKVKKVYVRILEKALNHKWIIVAATVLLFVGSIFSTMLLGKEVLPDTQTDTLQATIEFPGDVTTNEIFKQLDETTDLIRNMSEVETVGGIYGANLISGFMGGASDSASLYIVLKDDKKIKPQDVIQNIREATKTRNYEMNINADGADLTALMGEKISIKLVSKDLDTLYKSAQTVSGEISKIKGVIEIDDGIGRQADELRITVNKDKAIANGLTVAQVFVEANKILKSGSVLTTITDANTDYEIYVNKEGSSLTIDDVKNTVLTTPTNQQVKLSDIADVDKSKGFLSIKRDGGERFIAVTANIDDGYDLGGINKEIQKTLDTLKLGDDVKVTMSGQNQTMKDTFGDLYLMMILAIVFIYLVMVAQFQSLFSPFIVMFTIPLAFTGGFIAMLITGTTISAVSLIGLILLVGVVVNNGIVYVDYTNQLMDEGLSKREALLKAGNDRLRPILLTAMTTIFAQIALSIDTSAAAAMTKAMAITSIGGLTYATILTLFLVPVLFELLKREKKIKKA